MVLGSEIRGVIDVAVQLNRWYRLVEVAAVAGAEDAALVEGGGYPLMHGIERVIRDFVSALPGVDALQAALDALHAQGLFVGFLRRDRHDAAPDSGRAVALDLEQVEPFVRVGKIIAGAKAAAGCAEVEAGADLDEALGPGETLELDLRQPPHGAAPAIGADDVAAANFFALAGRVGRRHIDVVGALLETRDFGGKTGLGDAAWLDMRLCRPHQLVLLPLHHERIGHFALEQAEVEHGDEFAADAVAKVEDRREHSAAGD